MPDKIIKDLSKETKDPRKQRKQKLKLQKSKPRLLMQKLPRVVKKKLSTTRKLPKKRLGNVQVAISSITTNPEEEAQRVKVSLQPFLLPV